MIITHNKYVAIVKMRIQDQSPELEWTFWDGVLLGPCRDQMSGVISRSQRPLCEPDHLSGAPLSPGPVSSEPGGFVQALGAFELLCTSQTCCQSTQS